MEDVSTEPGSSGSTSGPGLPRKPGLLNLYNNYGMIIKINLNPQLNNYDLRILFKDFVPST
jgi:hypothetical protein